MSRTSVETHSRPIPSWLDEPPAQFHEPPQVRKQVSALPLDTMPWPEFERLVLRVVKSEVGVRDCRVYGQAGERQDGIDLLVLLDSGQIGCVQCKRVASFGPQDIENAIEEFERGIWASEATSFTLCVATALESTKVVRAIKAAHQRLAERGVTLQVWDASASTGLNSKLKMLPDIVEEFFGPSMVEHFNGTGFASRIGSANRSDREVARTADRLRLRLPEFLARSCVGFGPLGELRRPDLDRHFDDAISDSQGLAIAVHGDEGTGKSTALASWLRELGPSARWVMYASATEAMPNARNMDGLTNWLLASRLDISENEAARLRQRCPREKDLVIVDGLNERGDPTLWANLLKEAGSTATSNTQLLVVTRTEHLARMREAKLRTNNLRVESDLLVREVVVPDFSEDQVRDLLARMGDYVQRVPKYLRRPRMLQLAARHLVRIRTLSTVTYATLQLLELESMSTSPETFLDDLSAIATREATRANLPSGMSSFLEQLAIAQQSTTFRLDDWMDEDQERAWLVIGLWLRERLMSSDAHDVDEFAETIEQQLGSSQFDARSSILEYATTASLLDQRTSRPMRLALIDRWLDCRNCVRSPLGALGQLIALSPDDVFDGIEGALASGQETDLAVDIMLTAVQGPSRHLVLRRAAAWLGQVPVHLERFRAEERKDLSEDIREAAARGWSVSAGPSHPSGTRTVALHLFLAHPELMSRSDVASAVASMALNSTYRDDELLVWALRRDERDHRSTFDKLGAARSIPPRAARELERLRQEAYPDTRTGERLRILGKPRNTWHKELQQLALNPSWAPVGAESLFQEIVGAKSDIFVHNRRGQSVHEIAFDDCRASLTLHCTAWLRTFLSEWLQWYVDSGSVNPPALRRLTYFAPMLSSSDLSLLRKHARGLRSMVNAGDETARNAVTLIAEFSLHHQSPSRRLLTLARFMPEKALTSHLVEIVSPDADQTTWLAKQLERRPQEARRVSFVLRHCRSFSTQAVDTIRQWLGGLNCDAMSEYVFENTLILAWRVGADAFVQEKASSSDGSLRRMRDELKSLQLIANPDVPLRDVIQHSLPGHWPLWCQHHAVGRVCSQAVANALAFVAGVSGSLAPIVNQLSRADQSFEHERDGIASLAKQLAARLQSLRDTSLWRHQFHGQGLEYWCRLLPDYALVFLEASDEQLIHCFEVFVASVQASQAANNPHRQELIARRWRLEGRALRHTNRGYLRESVADAFTLSERVGAELWDEMLETVRDDAELLRVVVSAVEGNGAQWLRSVIDVGRRSVHAFRRARAEVICAMASLPTYRVQSVPQTSGWLAASNDFAKEVERSRERTNIWYRRFRLTTQESMRVGAWLNLVLLADVHFLEVVRDKDLHYSDSSRVYERSKITELRRAVEKRQEEMAKSLLGVPLPTGNVGWLSSMRRQV